ncbi:MAG: PqqD family peptide modification chaperone [Acetobacterales bacterium]
MKHNRPSAFDDVSVHMTADVALLYDRSRRALFAANPNAATICHGLEQRLSPAEVAEALSEEFGLPPREARRHVAATLRQWRQWCQEADRRDARAADVQAYALCVLPIAPGAAAATRIFGLLDTRFVVRFADGIVHEDVCRVLAHLETGAYAAGHERLFDVIRFGNGYAVAEAGKVHHVCGRADEVVAMVKATMAECAFDDADALAAIHAAAVERNGHCVLMPGRSGAGKSCLSAALCGSGFSLMGDDTVLLGTGDLALRPLPLGISIKDTAPPAIFHMFASLAQQPLFSRPDGKRIRYLTPPDIVAAPVDHHCPVTRIVFPRYMPGGGTELIPIPASQCLERLLACFAPLGGSMDRRDVDALVSWVASTPSYVLHVSSLAEAVRILHRLTD